MLIFLLIKNVKCVRTRDEVQHAFAWPNTQQKFLPNIFDHLALQPTGAVYVGHNALEIVHHMVIGERQPNVAVV